MSKKMSISVSPRALQAYIEGERKKQEECAAFVKTPEFSRLLKKFNQAVQTTGPISQMYLSDRGYPFTQDAFRRAVESVFENCPPKSFKEKDGTFPCYATNVGELGFLLIMGGAQSVYVVDHKIPDLNNDLAL